MFSVTFSSVSRSCLRLSSVFLRAVMSDARANVPTKFPASSLIDEVEIEHLLKIHLCK